MKLQIEKLVYGGAGLARQTEGPEAGKTVFVPFTLPGETVEAQFSTKKNSYGEASLLRVLEPSPERVKAVCVHFGECGGCQLQHANYSEQVRIKKDVLSETLERAGLKELPEIKVHTAEPWEYRNRIRLRVAVVEGGIQFGYNQRGSNEFLPIRECPIAAPLLWRAASALLHLAERDKTVQRWLHAVAEIELFANADQSRLQMTVFVRKPLSAGFGELCDKLHAEVPELTGAGVSLLLQNPDTRRHRTERKTAGANWGKEGLHYAAAGMDYWVSRGGFFQVNRFLVDEMVRLATQGRHGSLAWDLYAGVGLFSRELAKNFEQVAAVEGSETAAADLAGALKGKKLRAVHSSTLDFLRAAVVQRERPELVVMDPPRAGVGAEICALLARVKAAEMVYVSCDPVTLSRDLKAMVDSGHTLNELHLVDMFPQTFHVETVVMLKR